MSDIRIIDILRNTFAQNKEVLSAIIYGSWLYSDKPLDIDIAVIVPSESGVVESGIYQSLKDLRQKLSDVIGLDVDIVPHTREEIKDKCSSLWFPRSNPSLLFGLLIKGDFFVEHATLKKLHFTYKDFSRFLVFDTLTICRRQLTRTIDGEQGRIFVSKLLHGPGNALTLYASDHHVSYLCPTSNLRECFRLFDKIYGTNSIPAQRFLEECKFFLDDRKSLLLMRWYEHLAQMVLHEGTSPQHYQAIIDNLTSCD